MWRFKPFAHKEQTGLEGRAVDVGNLKIHVRNAIAEGGFSCVYLARDAINGSKQYAVKHIICNDEESLELVMKEISVMKSLRGHPNVVILHAHTIFDMGRTKEALLVMEFCDKSLVNVLESRGGAGYFEEKQILAMFRDICNAVFAMHCQAPPIAHRDLKAENLLLGSDGLWKLCDFGSISTNHKRFEKPEDMGIEEDNIRKHTTPAYRAPEMWDLFRKELINEKVDIWALGCLLFRICYLKSAFDGESKLQILNGNYRIPELPNYSSAITDLIRDMLQSSPEARPDITQIWFRVNGLLPDGLQKSLPDMPPEMHEQGTDTHEGIPKPANKISPMPRRSPPPPPSVKEPARDGPMGAFWATQHAKDSSPPQPKEENRPVSKTVHGNPVNRSENIASKDFEINLFPGDSKPNESFNAFVAEFDTSKLSPVSNSKKPGGREELLEAEVERLKQQLKQSNVEKAEANAKYEKLSAICRSQRQEIHDLKQALSSKTSSPNRDASPKNQTSPGVQLSTTHPQREKVEREKVEGTVFELQQGIFNKNSPSPVAKSWQPFANDDTKVEATSINNTPKSVRTRGGGNPNKQGAEVTSGPSSTWGFETETFTAIPTSSSQISAPISGANNLRGHVSHSKNTESKSASQPAGWAGF